MKIFDTIIAFVLLTSADSSTGHPQYLYKAPAVAFNEGEGGAESTTTASASAVETTTTTTEQNEVVETTPCCLKELARADVETTTGFGTETTTGSGTETTTGSGTETTTGSGTDTTTGSTIVETTATGQNDDPETTTTITTTTGAEEPERTEIPTTAATKSKISSPKPEKSDRTSGGKSLEIEELKSSDSLRTKCRNQKVGPGRFKFICDGVRQDLITLQYEHILWLTNDGSGQVIDIEVPNYKINELIKAGYKTTTGSDTEINVLLKRPQQDANAEVDDLVVPVPSPAVSVLYEPPISQIIHFPTNKKYRALSGPILPPN
jgi:hypothetical protein